MKVPQIYNLSGVERRRARTRETLPKLVYDEKPVDCFSVAARDNGPTAKVTCSRKATVVAPVGNNVLFKIVIKFIIKFCVVWAIIIWDFLGIEKTKGRHHLTCQVCIVSEGRLLVV